MKTSPLLCLGPIALALALHACTKDHAAQAADPGLSTPPAATPSTVPGTPAPSGADATTATHETPTAPAGATLMLYVDGKDSCRRLPDATAIAAGTLGAWGTGFAASIARVHKQDGVAPNYLIACLPLIGNPGDLDAYYVPAGATVAQHQHLAPDDFLAYVRDLVGKATGPVHVAGHSYGGWFVMKAAAGLPAGVSFTTLLTIDPISVVNCQPITGIADLLRTGAPASCNEAPADITAADRATIATHAGKWRNVYETANAYLHSSAIAEATENVLVDFPAVGLLDGLKTEDNPHQFVADADATWAPFGLTP